ncbi:MAG: FAD-dependent oxidoreductase [Actinobacteria bacterium]|nr:FAD-dependent oxidoreductase [Actinomycetota bacterium]
METLRTDLVVVGGGAAGLLAAVAARRLGHDVLVVEASPLVGGSTAVDGGRVWLPANHLMEKSGVGDSTVEAAEYLDAILGEPTEASSAERRAAYVETAPMLAHWLTSSKLALTVDSSAADVYRQAPGAKPSGRVLYSQPFDRRSLGEWATALRSTTPVESRGWRARRNHASRDGGALVAALLHRAVGNGVELWLDAQVTDLVPDGDGIGGVVVRRQVHGTETEAGITVLARAGVLLATGGFEGNQELREEYLPLPTDATWSAAPLPGDGAMISLGAAHGAATAAMDEAWWTPVLLADGVAHPVDAERAHPHSMIVDQTGSRFFDESAPADEAGRLLYERSHGVRAIPSYLIVDNRYRRAYPLGPWEAGSYPRSAIDSGDLVKASGLPELAQALGIDRAGLLGTDVRFNGFARKGRDQDFERGERLATASGGRRRNPSLGKVDKPPFWAVPVYPGDRGTKGGLLVDADARVLRPDGDPIPGLYACGGTAASMMGRTSPAPGAALGEALIGAFRAVLRLTEADPD